MAEITTTANSREAQVAQHGRIYDYGTVSMLSHALREMLSRFPSQALLDKCDDDDKRGTRPAPVTRSANIGEVRRWREVLDTYGVRN